MNDTQAQSLRYSFIRKLAMEAEFWKQFARVQMELVFNKSTTH